MKFSSILAAAAAGTTGTLAYPGMDKTLADIQLKTRQSGDSLSSGPSTELLGDLIDLPDGRLSNVGRTVKGILTGSTSAQDTRSGFNWGTPRMGSWLCGMDTCCVWKHIADEMAEAMVGSAGRCNDLARATIRLAFHDAGAWTVGSDGTGADGSIVLSDECNRAPDNRGLVPTCEQFREWHTRFNSDEFWGGSGTGAGRGRRDENAISMADLIQFAGSVATVTCPQGPRIRTFVGRKDNPTASPTGLLPSPFDTADALIELFGNKSFSADGLVTLLGAHSTSQQRNVDPSRAGDPQDSTPGVWDVRYYNETISDDVPERVFKFQSDINLANDPRTKAAWDGYAQDHAQAEWDKNYSAEFVRMTLLGVPLINGMTECTKALPRYTGSNFQSPDQGLMDEFMNGGLDKMEEAWRALLRGDRIPRHFSKKA